MLMKSQRLRRQGKTVQGLGWKVLNVINENNIYLSQSTKLVTTNVQYLSISICNVSIEKVHKLVYMEN